MISNFRLESGALAGHGLAGATTKGLEPIAAARPPMVSLARFQLPGGLLFAMLPPILFRFDSFFDSLANVISTSAGVFMAIVVGYYMLRRISSFPTIKEVGSVVPIFTISFLVVIGLYFLSRLEYNRFQFLTGYILTLIWFITIYAVSHRLSQKHFAVIKLGEAPKICDVTQAKWWLIDAPVDLPPYLMGVIVDLRADIPPHWEQYISRCVLAGVPVYHYKRVQELLTGRLEIEHLSENILGAHNPHDGYLKFKRVVDLLLALAAVILLAPLMALIAVWIRLDSQGPALFRQKRVKRGGGHFTIYKFRTMVVGSPREDGRASAMTRDGDPRITRIGSALRRTRIDELPQLFNIIKGEMSWIGPRPEAIPLAEWYEEKLPFYQYRHIVPPGLTGWAQVNQGHVTEPEHVLEKLHYDFFYIKNFSIWLDLLIVLKTLRIVVTGFGAR